MKFQDLLADKKTFSLALMFFEITKSCPKGQAYSLTDKIRRSTWSVKGTIAEANKKKI